MLTPLALILIFFFLCFFGVVCMFYHSLQTQEKALQHLMREQQNLRDVLEHVLLLLTRQGAFDQEDDEADDSQEASAPTATAPAQSPLTPASTPLPDTDFDAAAADEALIQATARPQDIAPLSLELERIPMPKPGGPDRLEL